MSGKSMLLMSKTHVGLCFNPSAYSQSITLPLSYAVIHVSGLFGFHAYYA